MWRHAIRIAVPVLLVLASCAPQVAPGAAEAGRAQTEAARPARDARYNPLDTGAMPSTGPSGY